MYRTACGRAIIHGMALRDELLRRRARKQQEVVALEQQIAGLGQQLDVAKAYLQAVEDTLKMVDRDAVAAPAERALRRGSGPAKAQKALRAVGHALHITKLLGEMGQPVNRKTRSALSSALAAYARKGEVFTRPAPNTFGLVEFPVGTDAGSNDEASHERETQIRLAR